MSSVSDEEPDCNCLFCAEMLSESHLSSCSTCSSNGPEPKTLTDMPDEVSIIIEHLQDIEWTDTHELSRRGERMPPVKAEDLEEGEEAYCEVSRQLVHAGAPQLDRLVQFEQLMSSKAQAYVKNLETVNCCDSPFWPIRDAVFNLSQVCKQIEDVITRLGYATHLRLPFDALAGASCIVMPEVWRTRVSKITLVFDDTFDVLLNHPSIHTLLSFFPKAQTCCIIWNNRWARNDPRWKSMICRSEDTPPIDNIGPLEVALQSYDKGNNSVTCNDWQLQFLLSRLDMPKLECPSVSDAGSMKDCRSVGEMKTCFETYYGNLAALSGKWLSLSSVSVQQIMKFDTHHIGICEHIWAIQLREFLLCGLNPRARNHLCISYVGLKATAGPRSAFSKTLEPNTPETFCTGFLDDLAPMFDKITVMNGE